MARNAPPRSAAADDEWDDEVPVEALPGSASAGADPSLRDGLLEVYAAVCKLHVMLEEADAEEFRVVGTRLHNLKTAVSRLPECARPRKSIGFVPAPRKPKRDKAFKK